MRSTARWWTTALLAAGCTGAAPEVATPTEAPPLTPLEVAKGFAERIEREVDCAQSNVRFVCALKELPGDPFVLPEKPRSWVGLLFALRPSRTIEDGTRETLFVARMTMGAEGAWIERIDQSGTAASTELPAVRLHAARAAMGEAPDVPVPEVLAGELDTRPLMPPAPVTQDDEGWKVGGDRPGQLWHVPGAEGRPSMWVVVQPVDGGHGGAFVEVFPDVPWRVPTPTIDGQPALDFQP